MPPTKLTERSLKGKERNLPETSALTTRETWKIWVEGKVLVSNSVALYLVFFFFLQNVHYFHVKCSCLAYTHACCAPCVYLVPVEARRWGQLPRK